VKIRGISHPQYRGLSQRPGYAADFCNNTAKILERWKSWGIKMGLDLDKAKPLTPSFPGKSA
jgi:hypothetical protein